MTSPEELAWNHAIDNEDYEAAASISRVATSSALDTSPEPAGSQPEMTEFPLSRYGDVPLVSIATGYVLPESTVSDRTARMYEIGSFKTLLHMATGDFLHDVDKPLLGELIGRIVTNAERQGIEIPDAGTRRHTPPVSESLVQPDYVNFPIPE